MSIGKTVLVLSVLALLCLLSACEEFQPSATPEPEATVVPTQASAPEPQNSLSESPPSQIFEIPWDDRSPFLEGLIEAERPVLERLPGATVYHLDMGIAPDLLTLSGRQAVHYTNTETEPLDHIYFRLYPNTAGGKLTVSELTLDGAAAELTYEFNDSALRVNLPQALQPGETTDIEMVFEVKVALEMEGNYGLFGYFEGVLALDEFYPVIPAYDDEGWSVKAPSPNGDLTHFDVSFYLVKVTAPKDLTIVASGVELEKAINGEMQSVTIAAGPMRDFYLVASDRFIQVSETLNETTVNSYAFEVYEQGAKQALQVTLDALKSYNERLGVYPYTEFDVASAPMMALGMEYPGATTIALRAYDPNEEISGLPSSVMLESVVAHEVAHQWFYSAVGNDQVDEPWLDEALVQYLSSRYYLDTYGLEAAQSYMNSWWGRWDRVEQAEIPIGLPSADYAEGQYGAIVYGRGPIFINALAEKMGQETFNDFYRDYYQSHLWSIGSGDAFRQLAEKHCQCDLSALFEAWVY